MARVGAGGSSKEERRTGRGEYRRRQGKEEAMVAEVQRERWSPAVPRGQGQKDWPLCWFSRGAGVPGSAK